MPWLFSRASPRSEFDWYLVRIGVHGSLVIEIPRHEDGRFGHVAIRITFNSTVACCVFVLLFGVLHPSFVRGNRRSLRITRVHETPSFIVRISYRVIFIFIPDKMMTDEDG